MMYYAMEKECQECKDETKFATGCWDGMDKEGRRISGMLTDCNNLDCPIKRARMDQLAKEEQMRCIIKIQNKENGIDIDLIREQSKKAGISVYEMSQILEMRPSEWSDRIYGRTAMEPGTAIRAMDAILKAKETKDDIRGYVFRPGMQPLEPIKGGDI